MIFAESRDLNNLENHRRFGDSRGFGLGITEVSTRKIVFNSKPAGANQNYVFIDAFR